MEQIRIEAFDPMQADERLLQQLSALYSEVEREIRPDIPPPLAKEYTARLQNHSKYRTALWWIALNQRSEIVGCSSLTFKRVPENPTVARIDVLVSQFYRRRRIGTALLVPLAKAAHVFGRKDFTCTAKEGSSGACFLKSIGAHNKGQSTESHLELKNLDEQRFLDMLDKFAYLREEYNFLWWENTCPEHWITDLAYAKMWLNTIPRGIRRAEIWSISSEWIREEERVRLNSGITWWTMVAIEKKTAKVVGFTDVTFSLSRPSIAMQQDTAVDLEHRGRGLASYLKANLILKLRKELPDICVLTTTNGSNNTGILQINQRLGFVSAYRFGKWEMDLDQLMIVLNHHTLLDNSSILQQIVID
jgi:GNAT superfamily N-acetyltransferase